MVVDTIMCIFLKIKMRLLANLSSLKMKQKHNLVKYLRG